MTSLLLDELLLTAAGLLGLGLVLYYVLRRRLKARLASLREAVGDSPQFADDRAHNLLVLARSEAATLRRTGADVQAAESAIAEAERALKRREFDEANRSARRAHELLLAQRANGGPLLLAPAASRSMPSSPPPTAPTPRPNVNPDPPAPTSSGDPESPPKLAKNRAESRFQIHLLLEEIDGTAAAPDSAARIGEARNGAAAAQSAYDRTDYTEALRLALRARRALGTRIESLPAPLTRIPPTPTPPGSSASAGPAGTVPCSTCGRPVKSTDRFCRACGTAKPATACSSCGTALEPDDRFCAGCGAPVS